MCLCHIVRVRLRIDFIFSFLLRPLMCSAAAVAAGVVTFVGECARLPMWRRAKEPKKRKRGGPKGADAIFALSFFRVGFSAWLHIHKGFIYLCTQQRISDRLAASAELPDVLSQGVPVWGCRVSKMRVHTRRSTLEQNTPEPTEQTSWTTRTAPRGPATAPRSGPPDSRASGPSARGIARGRRTRRRRP